MENLVNNLEFDLKIWWLTKNQIGDMENLAFKFE